MSNEQMILDKLADIEAKVAEIHEDRRVAKELRQDLSPLMKQSFYVMLEELSKVDQDFQLEYVFELVKRMMLSIRDITFMLEQMENVIDLWQTMEPLLKTGVPRLIHHLGDLEQKGVFRTYSAMLDVRAKVAQTYGAEDIEEMSDGFVSMIGLLKKLTTPETIEFLDRLSNLPKEINLDECKECGPFGMIGAMRSKEAKQGLGVMLEMTRALGKLKESSAPAEKK